MELARVSYTSAVELLGLPMRTVMLLRTAMRHVLEREAEARRNG